MSEPLPEPDYLNDPIPEGLTWMACAPYVAARLEHLQAQIDALTTDPPQEAP